jgi:hypothetical protein
MKYKNYIDDNYYVVFNSYLIVCFVLSMIVIILHVCLGYLICGIFTLIFTMLFTFFFYSRYYYVNKKELVVKIGWFTKCYNLKKIKKCYITDNILLSYATSKKRLCIEFDDYEIYISPEKMDEVLLELIKKSGRKKK